jgi:putative ABC transport system ATP-binding protein
MSTTLMISDLVNESLDGNSCSQIIRLENIVPSWGLLVLVNLPP